MLMFMIKRSLCYLKIMLIMHALRDIAMGQPFVEFTCIYIGNDYLSLLCVSKNNYSFNFTKIVYCLKNIYFTCKNIIFLN